MIELLIVLTIMGLLISIVAPFSLQAIDKANAKVELQETKNWLRSLTSQALIESELLIIELDEYQASLYANDRLIEQKQFDFVSFPTQRITINRFGFISQESVSAIFKNEPLSFSLQEPLK